MTHFLLIEDDPVFAPVLARALTRRGFTAACAATSEAALASLAASPPDAVVLDLNLAGESGLALLPPLRAALPEAGIVVLTGYASIATAVEAIKLGATHYLAKPATVDDILLALAPRTLPAEVAAAPPPDQTMSVRRLTWEHVQRVLVEQGGNVSATARALNMHRRTVQRMLSKRPVGQ